jgi:hypothetical protein
VPHNGQTLGWKFFEGFFISFFAIEACRIFRLLVLAAAAHYIGIFGALRAHEFIVVREHRIAYLYDPITTPASRIKP